MKERVRPMYSRIVPPSSSRFVRPCSSVFVRAFATLAAILLASTVSAWADDLLSSNCPRFVFEGPAGEIVVGGGDAGAAVSLPLIEGARIEVQTTVAREDDPRLQYKWRAPVGEGGPDVVLKWARYRLVGSDVALVLKEIVLENLPVGADSVRRFPGSIQSYPVFAGNRFYGVEFPVARTRVENGRLLLAYWPGQRLECGEWYETHRAVAGQARNGDAHDGRVLEAFRRYISAHAQFQKRHTDYNSWWTSPAPYYTEKDILDLMAVFEENMFKPYGAMFDTFCIDMGWSNKDSIWEIDPNLFPDGFSRLQEAAGRMNCKLGLWISPSSRYPPAQDINWAREHGYEAMEQDGLCLAGPNYSSAFRNRLVEMAQKYGIRHFKLDGYVFECNESNHGHEPGPLSADAIAQGVIAAADAVHAVAPDAWFEPTGFGYNPSPWWLLHFNSVIGCFGDDAPWGRSPAPDYREAYITGRDYFNLQSAHWSAVPQAGLEVLGVIHQTPEDFTNDAIVTILRGHQFLPFYVNPKYMDESRWAKLAGIVSAVHDDAASEIVPILPASWRDGGCPVFKHDDPMPRDPYGYLSVAPNETRAVLRNPWVGPQRIEFDLRPYVDVTQRGKIGLRSIYPEHRLYKGAIHKGKLDVELAPYETLVLDLTHPTERPPSHFLASFGGEVADGRPGSAHLIKVRHLRSTIRRVEYTGPSGEFGPDWTSLVGSAATGSALDLKADVTILSAGGELLVLHDGSTEPDAGATRISVNGECVEPVLSSSETGWVATGGKRPDRWRFLRVPLPQGCSHIQVETDGGHDGVLTSVWVRATRPGKRGNPRKFPPEPEVVSLDGKPLLKPCDLASKSKKTVQMERPVERIDGVFLDAVEPAEVTQGHGTLQKNQAVLESPLTIAAQQYRRGLGTHSPSRIVYALDGRFRKFEVWAGADHATGPTIEFEVRVDGQTRWQSGLMKREDAAKRVEVDVTGAKTLELITTDGGNGIEADHANWADAKLLR
ncbi:MAG TPA: NPCBM/NEW2 domain-containing protein [Candidatus Bathyarchaeia archaeon]|nr:NPCBM/NEW2 domain-containing protein [Candidatus Bathyarchaeia archaeon]